MELSIENIDPGFLNTHKREISHLAGTHLTARLYRPLPSLLSLSNFSASIEHVATLEVKFITVALKYKYIFEDNSIILKKSSF